MPIPRRGGSCAAKPMASAHRAPKMWFPSLSRRTSPLVFDGTRDMQAPYAVDVTGGGRSSAISRRMSASRVLGTSTSAIAAPRVIWDTKAVNICADQAVAAAAGAGADSTAGRGAKARVQKFMIDMLKSGPIPAQRIEEEAGRLGVTRSQLKTAKRRLGIETRKNGIGGGWISKATRHVRRNAPPSALIRMSMLAAAASTCVSLLSSVSVVSRRARRARIWPRSARQDA